MDRIITRVYDSPCGPLLLGSLGCGLCLCDWLCGPSHVSRAAGRLRRLFRVETEEGTSRITDAAAMQLDGYFAGRRMVFDVPLLLAGTDFQKKVWNGLLGIPYGETVSYGVIAKNLGMPRAVRAVANAVGANAISVIVPCHRVIGRDGTLTGYAGGLAAKARLLGLERAGARTQTHFC